VFSSLIVMLCLLSPAQEKKDYTKLRERVEKAVNRVREENKLPTLKRDDLLDKVAQKHAENMANQDKWADDEKKDVHVLDGKSFIERLKDEGHSGQDVEENVNRVKSPSKIIPGERAVSLAVGNWQMTKANLKIMLEPGYKLTGIGVAESKSGKWYVCQLYGK
jgi:uncharacterized protein YkwD